MLLKKVEKILLNSIITNIYIHYYKKKNTNPIEMIELKYFANNLLIHLDKFNNLKFKKYIDKIVYKKEYLNYIDNKIFHIFKKIENKTFTFSFSNDYIKAISYYLEYIKKYNIEKNEQNEKELLFLISLYLDNPINVETILSENFELKNFLLSKYKENQFSILEIKDKMDILNYIVKIFNSYYSNIEKQFKKIYEAEILNDSENHLNDNQKYVFREDYLYEISYKLLQASKANILITGEYGIGKRTILKTLPNYIKNKIVPLQKHKFIFINLEDILIRNDNEDFIMNIIESNLNEQNTKKEINKIDIIYQFLKEIKEKTIIIFDCNDINLNIDRKFKELLEKINDVYLINQNIQFILINDNSDYLNNILNDKFFNIIKIKQPNFEEMVQFIYQKREEFYYFYKIDLNQSNIETIIKLINKEDYNYYYIMDIFDTILSKYIIDNHDKEEINNKDIIKYYYKKNENNIENKLNDHIFNLEKDLNNRVYGQKEIIKEITDRLKIYQVGLNEKHKPIASFMFSGNSGTGKTEIARQLSNLLNMKLLRYDMSEFQESHSISKFLGSPAGYVGYEEGSPLINDLTKNPNSILLLDEIEKAHTSVIKIFLQILEEGTLKGSNGESIDLSNILVIFTTNAGAKHYSEKETGFLSNKINDKAYTKIQDDFPIEFLNRIDNILYFNNLNKEDLKKIVDKEIKIILNRLNKSIKFNISKEAYEYLTNIGYDINLGAREIKRIIDKNIKLLLAQELIKLKERNNITEISINYNNSFKLKLS